MSGDYETLEINQPKITYFQKRSENNTEWLDELIILNTYIYIHIETNLS